VINESNNEKIAEPAPEAPAGPRASETHHTESPSAAQGTPDTLQAQNEFLKKLSDRIRNLEVRSLAVLGLPSDKLPASRAFGFSWTWDIRRAYRAAGRIKKRMRSMANP
jgi:hypothetical protein